MIHAHREGEGGRVLVLELDRPEAKNALDRATITALSAILHAVPSDVRGLVVTGGGGTFVSGGDLRELRDVRDRETTERFCDFGRDMCDRLEDLPIPVVAAIEGHALGGGAELACACDTRVAGESAKIGFVQVRMGVTTAWGTYARLVAQVGVAVATELLLGARAHSAEEARARGLVEHVVPSGTARARAVALAEAMSRGAPLAVAYVKELARVAKRNAALRAKERERFVETWLSPDHAEAVAAFFEKREPTFRG